MSKTHVKRLLGIKEDFYCYGRVKRERKTTTIRKAARLFEVAESTLRSRLNGHIDISAGLKHRKLTPTEEESLHTWILSMESHECPIRPHTSSYG